MKTLFALSFIKCEAIVVNTFDATQGPFMFGSLKSAQDFLIEMISLEVRELYSQQFFKDAKSIGIELADYCGDQEHLDNLTGDDAYEVFRICKSESLFQSAIDWYKGVSSNSGIIFNYQIKEVPEKSLLECLEDADAIEVDEFFIRYFTVTSPDEQGVQDTTALEASTVDESGDTYNFIFDIQQINAAVFHPETKSWEVGDYSLRTYLLK